MTPLRAAAAVLALACGLALTVLWPPRRNTLVIYSAMGPPGPAITAFEREAGVPVRYVNMNGNALLARIYAEGRHPGWDVAWFVGDAAAAELDRSGLLRRAGTGTGSPAAGSPVTDPLAPGTDWTPDARTMLPGDGSAVPTGLVLAGVFLTRRTPPAQAQAQAPAPDWTTLRSWPGGIGLVSPALSGTAFPVLSGLMTAVGGVEPGHAFLRALTRSCCGRCAPARCPWRCCRARRRSPPRREARTCG